jgi:hypothetical protein
VIITATDGTGSNSPLHVPVSLTLTGSVVAPTITTQPSNQTLNSGQTATFNVAATGTSPMTYQWSKNGVAISGATSSSYTTPAETSTDNSAKFTAVVTNSAGSATSSAAILTVTATTATYQIVPTPTSLSFSGAVGATLSCQSMVVVAYPATPLPVTLAGSAAWITVTPSSGTTYVQPIPSVCVNTAGLAAGSYSGSVIITATDGTGSNSPLHVPVSLTLTGSVVAPTITTQPSSQTLNSGQTATFNVAATGTSPMTYQWSKNSVAISGATSSTYTTPAETASDNSAKFTAVVANSAGSATSNAATLTVSASTLILNSSVSSLSFGNVNVSSTATQNVTLNNAGNSTVTVSGVTLSGAGFSASGVSTGLILNPGQTASLAVTFNPSGAGSITGNVTVASNASNSPDAITISGTGAAVTNYSVNLSWTASTSTVMGYNTYSSTVSGGPYNKLTSSPAAGTSFTDSTVQAGKTYYYVVTSVDSSGMESANSSQVTAAIP